jgi:serine phosphatase RsbU (regulator of sigma subunit)
VEASLGYCVGGYAGAGVLALLVWARTRMLHKRNEELERAVRERTFDLELSREELRSQRDELESQTHRLETQAKQIADSITYAERIQRALLNAETLLSNRLADYFIFFQPKDVVSGDFYCASLSDDKLIIVAADCTGHGVPGAFLSMLGVAFLNEIAVTSHQTASEILDLLRSKVKNAFRHNSTKFGLRRARRTYTHKPRPTNYRRFLRLPKVFGP